MSEQNKKIVQNAYAAFGRGDIPGVLATLDPNVDWEAVIGADPATVPTAGARRGVDAVAGFFKALGETTVFEQFEPREFIAEDDQVACIGFYKARVKKTGGVVSSSWVMVFTVRNGRIVRFREWSDSAQVNRAYGAAVL
jgi:ketosteroid isomerase-like protein